MHPVIENLLARRNKKVPVSDGKKIGLVLYGGFMAGIRGVGAMIALEELGLADAFDEIFTYSAGFPNAAYFVTKKSRLAASVYYEDLTRNDFIKFWRLWNIVEISKLLKILKEGKPLWPQEVLSSKTKIYTRLVRFPEKNIEYKEVHEVGESDFWNLMKATTSASFVSPGKTKIGGVFYKDLGIFGDHWVEHINYALSRNLTDLLIIYCYAGQAKKHRPRLDKIFEIIPSPDWKMSRLETNPEVLKNAALGMGQLVKNTFGFQEGIML